MRGKEAFVILTSKTFPRTGGGLGKMTCRLPAQGRWCWVTQPSPSYSQCLQLVARNDKHFKQRCGVVARNKGTGCGVGVGELSGEERGVLDEEILES